VRVGARGKHTVLRKAPLLPLNSKFVELGRSEVVIDVLRLVQPKGGQIVEHGVRRVHKEARELKKPRN
jgi:hypothetical protein